MTIPVNPGQQGSPAGIQMFQQQGPQSRLFPGIGFSWAQSMANKRPNPATQLKSPPTVLADPAGIQQAMAKVGNVTPLQAGNGRLVSFQDGGEALQRARMHVPGPEARQAATSEITKVSGDATRLDHGLPGGEPAHGLGRSSLLLSATPVAAATTIPSLLAKLAAQDNTYPQRSASGEAHGLSYVHKADDYATGQDAWSATAKYLHGGGKGHKPDPFTGDHDGEKAAADAAPGFTRLFGRQRYSAPADLPKFTAVAPKGAAAAGQPAMATGYSPGQAQNNLLYGQPNSLGFTQPAAQPAMLAKAGADGPLSGLNPALAAALLGGVAGGGAMLGGGMGSLVGLGRGNLPEGLGRGLLRGGAAGLGYGAGSLAGAALGHAAGLPMDAAAGLGGVAGGALGYGLAGKAMGPPAGAAEEEIRYDLDAKQANDLSPFATAFFARCRQLGYSQEKVATVVSLVRQRYGEKVAAELESGLEKQAWGQYVDDAINAGKLGLKTGWGQKALGWIGGKMGLAEKAAPAMQRMLPGMEAAAPSMAARFQGAAMPTLGAATREAGMWSQMGQGAKRLGQGLMGQGAAPQGQKLLPGMGGGRLGNFLRPAGGQGDAAARMAGGALTGGQMGEVDSDSYWDNALGAAAGAAFGRQMPNMSPLLQTAGRRALAGGLAGTTLDTAAGMAGADTNFGQMGAWGGMLSPAVAALRPGQMGPKVQQAAGMLDDAFQKPWAGMNPINPMAIGRGIFGKGVPTAQRVGTAIGPVVLMGGTGLKAANTGFQVLKAQLGDAAAARVAQQAPQILDQELARMGTSREEVMAMLQQGKGLAGMGGMLQTLSGLADQILGLFQVDPSQFDPMQKLMMLLGGGAMLGGMATGSGAVAGLGGLALAGGLLPSMGGMGGRPQPPQGPPQPQPIPTVPMAPPNPAMPSPMGPEAGMASGMPPMPGRNELDTQRALQGE